MDGTPQEKQTVQAPQEPAPQDPKGTQKTPQQVAEEERQYMELQATFALMRQRTIVINQLLLICNMQETFLNDLAKAMKGVGREKRTG